MSFRVRHWGGTPRPGASHADFARSRPARVGPKLLSSNLPLGKFKLSTWQALPGGRRRETAEPSRAQPLARGGGAQSREPTKNYLEPCSGKRSRGTLQAVRVDTVDRWVGRSPQGQHRPLLPHPTTGSRKGLTSNPQPSTLSLNPKIFSLHCATIDTQNASYPLTDESPRGILDSWNASTPHRNTTWTCRTLPTPTSLSISEPVASYTPPHGPTGTGHAG